MTFKDLRAQLNKLREQEQYKTSDDYDALLNDSKGIPFWLDLPYDEHFKIRNEYRTDRDNSTCCFWDLIGRPVKHNEEKPLFDYQHIVLNALKYFLKIRIKKFRGAGLTELLLRYPAYLCLSKNDFRNKKAFIITGITQELANDHILRLRNLFLQYYPGAIEHMDYTQKTINLNQSLFRAYPAANPEAPRGKTDVFFILADEFDHHTRRQQEDMMSVITPYRPKTDTMIVLNSTTKNPQGLYAEMDKQWTEFLKSLRMNKWNINYNDLLRLNLDLNLNLEYIKNIRRNIKHHYFLLEFDYLWGLGPGTSKIYTQEEIDEIKDDPVFEGEFCLVYEGHLGNVFNTREIELAIEKGKNYDPDKNNDMCQKSIGIDPAFGSSAFGIVVTQWQDQQIQILHAEEYQRPDFNVMLEMVWSLYDKYHPINKIYVDGANPSFIKSLKIMLGERSNYETVKKEHWRYMKVQPVNFATRHKAMLAHSKLLLEKGYLAINEKFDKLITSLRTAFAVENTLDKEATSYNDVYDSFRLALEYYQVKGNQ